MWQRKQTIYLLLVVFLMLIALFLTRDLVLQIASGVVALLANTTIFRFKDRKQQIKMCLVGQVLLLLWMIYFAVMHFYVHKGATAVPFYVCLPLVSYILYRLARMGIQHDEDLVRSADRIR